MFTLGGISAFIFLLRFVVFTFQESPKFLLSKGRDEEALAVLQSIAKLNGTKCNLTMDTFASLQGSNDTNEEPAQPTKKTTWTEKAQAETSRLRILFSTPTLTRLTILVWTIYFFDYWGFSVAGSFLPTILKRKNAAIHVGISETYRDYIIINLPGILGVGLGSYLVYDPRIGRKPAMLMSATFMAGSLFAFALVNTQAANVGLNTMEYFWQSMFNAVLYGWTPEAFPAEVRGTASGLASFWGRAAGIFSPLVAAGLLERDLNGPLYLAGAGVLVCVVAIAALPGRSLGGQSL